MAAIAGKENWHLVYIGATLIATSPPPHPPCPHLAPTLHTPSSCHRGVLELSSLQPMQVIPAYFLPKVALPGRQMCQKCQFVKSGSKLHITPNICTSWGLQVAPGGSGWIQVVRGGSRWFQVDPGGSRWFQAARNPHKYPQLLHILDFERKNSASGKSA